MAISAGKVAPSAIVLAFVGYCVWPSVSELTSASSPTSQVNIPELAATLFSPLMPPRPTKNPWGGRDEASLAAAKEAAKAAEKAAKVSAGSTVAKKPADPLDGLRLEATCILGNQQVAMINGHLYAPQEMSSAGNSSAPQFRVVSVFPNSVLLECQGKTVELTYEGVVSRLGKSPTVESAKSKLAKTDPLDLTAVVGRVAPLWQKLSAATTALQSGGKNESGKAGD